MAIVRVQQVSNQGTAGPTASATLSATVSANLLIAVVITQGGTASAPSGFSTAISNSNVNHIPIYLFYRANAPSSTTISSTVSGPRWIMFLAEYSGISTTSPLDQTGSASTNTSPASSGSVTTTSASELIVVGMSNNFADTYSSPTNSFNLLDQRTVGVNTGGAYLDRIVSVASTYNTDATCSNGSNGVIASFKAPGFPVGSTNNAVWFGSTF